MIPVGQLWGPGSRTKTAREFSKHSCRSLVALPKTCQKLGVVAEFFFAKSAGRCFTPLIEIEPNRDSLRWNFYADIQLIRGKFWLQLCTLKSSASHAYRENTLLKCAKFHKCLRRLQRVTDGRGLLVRRTSLCCVCCVY